MKTKILRNKQINAYSSFVLRLPFQIVYFTIEKLFPKPDKSTLGTSEKNRFL